MSRKLKLCRDCTFYVFPVECTKKIIAGSDVITGDQLYISCYAHRSHECGREAKFHQYISPIMRFINKFE